MGSHGIFVISWRGNKCLAPLESCFAQCPELSFVWHQSCWTDPCWSLHWSRWKLSPSTIEQQLHLHGCRVLHQALLAWRGQFSLSGTCFYIVGPSPVSSGFRGFCLAMRGGTNDWECWGSVRSLENSWKDDLWVCCVTPVRETVWVLHTCVFTGPRFAQAELCILWDGELPVELSGIWCESILHFW